MIDQNHITSQGVGFYYSKLLKRWCKYWWENEFIIPDLSPDECLAEEDIIEEIKNIKKEHGDG